MESTQSTNRRETFGHSLWTASIPSTRVGRSPTTLRQRGRRAATLIRSSALSSPAQELDADPPSSGSAKLPPHQSRPHYRGHTAAAPPLTQPERRRPRGD